MKIEKLFCEIIFSRITFPFKQIPFLIPFGINGTTRKDYRRKCNNVCNISTEEKEIVTNKKKKFAMCRGREKNFFFNFPLMVQSGNLINEFDLPSLYLLIAYPYFIIFLYSLFLI